jgi:diadenosine tetraphosphate (Ap4A) HIT family hydrolase
MGRKLQINYKISRMKVLEDRDCWFCIENPKIEKNLIIKQGKHFYSAFPKGPVSDEHFLIIPNRHIAHSLELDDVQEAEYLSMKSSIVEYLLQDKSLDYLLFERNIPFNFQKAAHMNV